VILSQSDEVLIILHQKEKARSAHSANLALF
jgi:hypothetical protein